MPHRRPWPTSRRPARLLDGRRDRDPDGGVALALRRWPAGRCSLKCENLQRTGSFKIRGAYVRISRLTRRGARPRRGRGLGRQPRPGRRAGRAAARHQGDRVHARGRADPEGARRPGGTAPTCVFHGQLPRRTRWSRPGSSPSETGAVLIHPFDHVDIVAGQGTVRARDPRAGARRADRAGADRRRRAARRHRDRDQGAAPRRPRRRRPGGRRRGVPGVAGARRARSPLASMTTMADGIAVGLPGRRHRSPRSATTSTRSSPSPRSRCRGRCWPLLERAKMVVEPAGAAAVAALLDQPARLRDARWSRCSPAATSTRCCSAR